VLKRLDDVSDDVRVAAVTTLVKLFKPLPTNYCMEISFGHLDALFSTMLIHLDDPDPYFQRTMLGMELQPTFEIVLSHRYWTIQTLSLVLAPVQHVRCLSLCLYYCC
jgi:hypothetical protein